MLDELQFSYLSLLWQCAILDLGEIGPVDTGLDVEGIVLREVDVHLLEAAVVECYLHE